VYKIYRQLGADPASEFYLDGKPRRGASHQGAYWNGRSGVQPGALIDFSSLNYAAWCAGRDERQADLDKDNPMPRWVMRGDDFYPPEGWTHL
jgi:hypothetical protein